MQKFQFALEKALEWRTTRLQLENAKLAKLRQERSALLQLSQALVESGKGAASGMLEGAPSLTGADLSNLATYRQNISARVNKLVVTTRHCDRQIERQTKCVVEADREKQLLEKLRERQFEEWNYELKREIENTAGELFLARWTPSS